MATPHSWHYFRAGGQEVPADMRLVVLPGRYRIAFEARGIGKSPQNVRDLGVLDSLDVAAAADVPVRLATVR